MVAIRVQSHGKELPVKALQWFRCKFVHRYGSFFIYDLGACLVSASLFCFVSQLSGLGLNGTMGYSLNSLMSLKTL